MFRASVSWNIGTKLVKVKLFYILVDCIENHPLIQSDTRSLKLLNDAKTYQLLPTHHGDIEINTKPRLLKADSAIYLVGGETRSQVCHIYFWSKLSVNVKLHRWESDAITGASTYNKYRNLGTEQHWFFVCLELFIYFV